MRCVIRVNHAVREVVLAREPALTLIAQGRSVRKIQNVRLWAGVTLMFAGGGRVLMGKVVTPVRIALKAFVPLGSANLNARTKEVVVDGGRALKQLRRGYGAALTPDCMLLGIRAVRVQTVNLASVPTLPPNPCVP